MPKLRHPNTLLFIALSLGVCADFLFYERAPGLSVPLFTGLGLAALFGLRRAEGRAPERRAMLVGGAALGFAMLSMLRAAPLLVALNISATLGLLLLLTVSCRGARIWRLAAWQIGCAAALAACEIVARPLPLALRQASRLPMGMPHARALAPVARGLLLAVPVVCVFTGLLMAADSLFASYVVDLASLELPFDLSALLPHAMVGGFFAWACAGGMLTALRPAELPAEGDTQRLSSGFSPRFLGWGEAMTVLVAVDALFAGFMLVQGTYFFGGSESLARTGLSHAEYARRGFFELLAVACLTLAMLTLLATITRREVLKEVRSFNWANGAMVALVLGMLASAFQRMWLYEQAYGFTRLRIYTHSFMLWLALALILFIIGLALARPRLFSIGSFATALAYLAVLTLANPDALIVQANLARHLASPEAPIEKDRRAFPEMMDLAYLGQLSSDATPAILAALPQLDGASREVLRQALADQRQALEQVAADDGWPSWHLARARALQGLQTGL